jgi:serine phosphatase RsbU (regulator of sigma subunit)
MTVIGRLTIRTKLALLAGVPVVGTLILAAVIAVQASRQAAAAAALGSIEDVAQLSVRITAVIHSLQRERAGASLREGFQRTNAARTDGVDAPRLGTETDTALLGLERFLAGRDMSRVTARLARDLGIARGQTSQLDAFRSRAAPSIDQILAFYDAATDALVSAIGALAESSDDGELSRSIASLVSLSQLTERASREHALLSYVFAAGEFPPGTFKTFLTLTTEQDVYADAFLASASTPVAEQYRTAQRSAPATTAQFIRERAVRATDDDFDIDPRSWFDAEGDRVSSFQDIERDLLMRITNAATTKMHATRMSIRIGLWLSAAVILLSSLLAWIVARGITRAVFALTSASAHVRETKDFTRRAEKTSNDELGTLTDAFNEMLLTIHQRDTYLEVQVAERTEELRRTVAELWSEMDLARKIQTVLLPQSPSIPGYEIAAIMVPAASVGGDYYDVFRSQGTDWILIGDVSGHGVTAGLTMMIVQTAVRTVIQSAMNGGHTLTPKGVLNQVNAAVRSNLQKINPDQYMTIMALELRDGRVRYSGLHQDVLVFRAASGEVERFETRGLWIGVVDDVSTLLDDDEFQLEPGDLLLLHTDGITETIVGERRLGTDGLAAAFQKLAAEMQRPDAVVKGVMGLLGGVTLVDDVTLLAARYASR